MVIAGLMVCAARRPKIEFFGPNALVSLEAIDSESVKFQLWLPPFLEGKWLFYKIWDESGAIVAEEKYLWFISAS